MKHGFVFVINGTPVNLFQLVVIAITPKKNPVFNIVDREIIAWMPIIHIISGINGALAEVIGAQ